MLEAAARQQHAGVDQGLDAGVVGVALFALVVDDAFSREARRLLGEGAVFVDGVGDGGVDAARCQFARIRRPDVEILAAVSGRRMHKTGAGVIGDVVAGEQRDFEAVAFAEACKWMCCGSPFKHSILHRTNSTKPGDSRLLENIIGQFVSKN